MTGAGSASRGGWFAGMHHRSHDQGGLPPGGLHQEGLPPGWGSTYRGCADPPDIHGILWDMVNKRAVRILLECILVSRVYTCFLTF